MSENLSVKEVLESIKKMMKTPRSNIDLATRGDVLELTEVANNNDPVTSTLKENDNNAFDVDIGVPSNKGDKGDSLLSEKVTAAIANDFKKFAHYAPKYREGKTVEELVIEIMKQPLQSWLEHNLPKIVHELVKEELSKIRKK